VGGVQKNYGALGVSNDRCNDLATEQGSQDEAFRHDQKGRMDNRAGTDHSTTIAVNADPALADSNEVCFWSRLSLFRNTSRPLIGSLNRKHSFEI
jgi:hypothetical protein